MIPAMPEKNPAAAGFFLHSKVESRKAEGGRRKAEE
jgi:hypothetical protein